MVEWKYPAMGGDVSRPAQTIPPDMRAQTVRALYRSRYVNWGARVSAVVVVALMAGSWLVGDFDALSLVSARRVDNLTRFLGDIVPFPLQGQPFDAAVMVEWVADLMRTRGLSGALNTLAISVAAIVLAGIGGAGLSLAGARTLATDSPYMPPRGDRGYWLRTTAWMILVDVARLAMIFFRAIPEYVWAFLFLAMWGPIAWPLVLALAVHNMGILGRLGAEVVENTPAGPMSALAALGASRLQLAAAGVVPQAFSRFLLFFFYRWETAVREATVLGMLGISSLGFWIQDARARNHYDDMVLLVLIGGVLVLVGDFVSAFAREWVRREE